MGKHRTPEQKRFIGEFSEELAKTLSIAYVEFDRFKNQLPRILISKMLELDHYPREYIQLLRNLEVLLRKKEETLLMISPEYRDVLDIVRVALTHYAMGRRVGRLKIDQSDLEPTAEDLENELRAFENLPTPPSPEDTDTHLESR